MLSQNRKLKKYRGRPFSLILIQGVGFNSSKSVTPCSTRFTVQLRPYAVCLLRFRVTTTVPSRDSGPRGYIFFLPDMGLSLNNKQESLSMNHEKVLIVEDEENERTGLAELITSWGYRTDTARDGVEALEKVTGWTPSIVVTDLKMPRMGGMELLDHLAADKQPMAVVLV